MVTITRPSRHEPSSPIREPESMPAAEISPASVEVAAPSPSPRQENLLVLIARSLVAFHGWLSGPGMTKRERTEREITETGRKRCTDPLLYRSW